MKKIISVLILCLFIITGCTKTDTAEYKTDVTVSELSTKMLESVSLESLTMADEGWIALNIPIDTSLCESFVVYISVTGGSDLFGVFKASTAENAEEVLKQAEEYLTNMEENWMSEYLPEDLPKIQNAVSKQCGLYVTFVIFDDTNRNSAIQQFEDLLKK